MAGIDLLCHYDPTLENSRFSVGRGKSHAVFGAEMGEKGGFGSGQEDGKDIASQPS
jgi:hypothetical protein